VKDVVLDILMQLNGGPFPLDGWRNMPEEAETLKEWTKFIGDWHATANKHGEEKYILSRVLGDDEDDHEFRPGLLWLLAEKYPQRLPEVFRTAVDTRIGHARYAWEYARAVAGARIPDADKRKVLEHAAAQDQPGVREAGIYFLRPLDPKRAKERALRALAEIPGYRDGDAALAFVVAEGADADEWAALARAVRRANAARQIDLLCGVLCAKTPEGRKHRIAFLTQYLADEAGADAPAGRAAQAEARHLAGTQLAALLLIETGPYPTDWTAAPPWAELRDDVKAELWP
jgi:hypothetical protein